MAETPTAQTPGTPAELGRETPAELGRGSPAELGRGSPAELGRGKYRLLTALGQGGMAQVYRAYQPQLDRYVAIKILRTDLDEQAEFLGRFRREAQAVSSLRHPNIIQIFDFDVQDERPYMVMELLEGDTLRARLNQCRLQGERMPLAESVRILQEVLAGLAYAHAAGIIHRDIKPANILLTRRGQAVLTDFGIAQIVGATRHTVSGALLGTLSYMAPEQGLSGECDPRSDLYSLGIVFYEMLTGSPPFEAATPLAILLQHLNDSPPPPCQLDPDLPPALEQITLKALAKQPADRYQSAAEMLSALDQALGAGLPATARRALAADRHASAGAAPGVYSGAARQQLLGQPITTAETAAAARIPALARLETLIRPISPVSSLLLSLTVFSLVNLAAASLGALTGRNLLQTSWPFEIFLVAALLAFLGWGTQTPWLLLPVILLGANAALLGYAALTGRWTDWSFLWMVEPLVVGVSIYLPARLAERSAAEARFWARLAGLTLGILCILLAVLLGWLALPISHLPTGG